MAREVFNPEECGPDVRVTDGNEEGGRAEMEQALVEHVYGQPIVKIEFNRTLDTVLSVKMGRPVEYTEMVIYLGNNICYLFRVTSEALGIIRQGEGLGKVDPTSPNYQS